MKALAFILAVLQIARSAWAELPEGASIHSQSGQFIVRTVPGPAPLLRTPSTFLHLQPSLVVVSCERIKQALERDLASKEPWKGRIFIHLVSRSSLEQEVTITAQAFQQGLQYEVTIPEWLDRALFVRSVVEVYLMELANRHATAHAAEVPRWLVEGFTQDLLASNELELVLPPPERGVNGLTLVSTELNQRRENPLKESHDILRTSAALTFDGLSWPGESELTGTAADIYRCSAHLFVTELLRLKDGRACLLSFLTQIPSYYNWQLAFLHAFAGRFNRPLEVEKWWALRLAQFTGRELGQTWSFEESWAKLSEIVAEPILVRTRTNDLPFRSAISLQTILRQWQPARRTDLLRQVIMQLTALQPRVAPAFAGLVEGYRDSLDTFLKQGQTKHISLIPFAGKNNEDRSLQQTLKQLDALDARRESLRPGSSSSPVVKESQRDSGSEPKVATRYAR